MTNLRDARAGRSAPAGAFTRDPDRCAICGNRTSLRAAGRPDCGRHERPRPKPVAAKPAASDDSDDAFFYVK